MSGETPTAANETSLVEVGAISHLLPVIDGLSRRAAQRLGYRPRNRILVVDERRCYEHHIGQPALQVDGEVRGLCGPGPTGSALNVIWVAPAPLGDLLETLTHEYAHAVMPRAQNHTSDWLEVHLAVLRVITSPAHATLVRDHCLHRYGLR